jgi:dolichol kinase
MEASLAYEPTHEALNQLVDEVREFIDRIQTPRPADHKWRERVHQAGDDLSARMQAFAAGAAERQNATLESMRAMAERLRAYTAELSDSPNMQALKERRDHLARAYEELLLELKERRVARAAALAQSRQLKPRNYARNAFHISNGVVAVTLYHFFLTRAQSLYVLGTIFAVFATLEITRKFSDRWNDFLVDKVFGAISRPSERYRVNSATIYLLALILICYVFPKPAVEAAILVLGLGDPIASLVGKRFGKRKLYLDKSWAGSLAFFATAFAAVGAWVALTQPELGLVRVAAVAGAMALVGAVTELFSTRIDDNFSIPVACAAVGALLL